MATFNATSTYAPPATVTRVMVECWGAGASGSTSSGGASGGGGGAYARSFLKIASGTTYTVTVGTGGPSVGTIGADGTAGGDTWFSTSGTILAKGGAAGLQNGNAALGGQAGSCIGDFTFSGGSSGTALSGGGSSGGGGSAGSTGAGGSSADNSAANNTSGGIAGTGSPAGAAGGNGSGGSGTAPGAGGGGKGSGFSGSGAGAAGRIIITEIYHDKGVVHLRPHAFSPGLAR